MVEITAPRIDPDGTHVIPVRMIHKPGEAPNKNSSGEVRWSRREGLTFRFQTFLTSFLVDFPEDLVQDSGGVGSVSAVSMNPEWYAETSDGSTVKLYATSSIPTTSVTTSWSIENGSAAASSKTVEGTACYAEIGLHRDNPVAFWYETLPGPRLFSPGWEISKWPDFIDYQYTIDGANTHRTRGCFTLDVLGGRTLVSGSGIQEKRKGVWLTYQPGEQQNEFWFPESCDRFRRLMSILLGQHVVYVWRDTPDSADRLTRLYFGWHKGVDLDHSNYQIVPFFGTIEAMNHGYKVINKLCELDRRFTELYGMVDLEWITSPIWAAERDFIDNKLAHACVALERLSSAYHHKIRPENIFPKPPNLIPTEQKERLLDRLQTAFSEVAASNNFSEDAKRILVKKIDNLCQPTNNDRLVMVFEELGIRLTTEEKKVIGNRNKSLHGTKTLENGKDTSQSDRELQRFDILRTLIGRAILHLLGYDGPYVDYGARPGTGNFPILSCIPPARVMPTNV